MENNRWNELSQATESSQTCLERETTQEMRDSNHSSRTTVNSIDLEISIFSYDEFNCYNYKDVQSWHTNIEIELQFYAQEDINLTPDSSTNNCNVENYPMTQEKAGRGTVQYRY